MPFGSIHTGGGAWKGFPGPRDWSPAIEKAKEELKLLQTVVPEGMKVSLKDIQESEFPEIVRLVENGFAFIIKIGISYHAVYVSPNGKIHMDLTVQQNLRSGS